MRKIVVLILSLLFILLIPFVTYVMEYVPVKAINKEKVLYNLPYPGILPDNPLYLVKALRDRFLELGTRDNTKKAELYLLYSDKRFAMAIALSKKGNEKRAVETASKGEKYFFKIPPLLVDAKKQGTGTSSEFIETLRLSNSKHQEILETFIKELPQGLNESINGILEINSKIKKSLETL
ncbi:hypothetical protein HY041_01340 [Candidatus Roizmanbacteria bacterium]|nr:hypothetical protein [Candidatus Roizmanbacteria bacterium]